VYVANHIPPMGIPVKAGPGQNDRYGSVMLILEFTLAAIFVVLLLLFITVAGNLGSTGRDVERVERKLDLVIKHLGIEGPTADGIPSDVLAEIDRCIWSDRRAEAIKLYRGATGHDAVAAKEWISRRAESY
jgi:hypothetical protein